MGQSKIKTFYGYRDGKEDPAEYLEDVQFAYESSHALKAPTDEEQAKAYEGRVCRILFRQNLKGEAAKWYSELKPVVKSDWVTLSKTFSEAYVLEEDVAADTYQLMQRVANLAQKENEGIAEYLRRGEDLSRRLPEQDLSIGFNFVRGMRDVRKKA